ENDDLGFFAARGHEALDRVEGADDLVADRAQHGRDGGDDGFVVVDDEDLVGAALHPGHAFREADVEYWRHRRSAPELSYLTNLDACSRRHAGHLARHLNGPLIALRRNDHEAADQLLGLGKRPIGYAGRADDFPARLEAAAHIHDFHFELLLPRCERGLHLLHLGRTRLLLFAGRAAANEEIALCRH